MNVFSRSENDTETPDLFGGSSQPVEEEDKTSNPELKKPVKPSGSEQKPVELKKSESKPASPSPVPKKQAEAPGSRKSIRNINTMNLLRI